MMTVSLGRQFIPLLNEPNPVIFPCLVLKLCDGEEKKVEISTILGNGPVHNAAQPQG
jgi:hypothetical protein